MRRRARKLVFNGLGFCCLGLAAAGAVLPVLPTTIFVILAAGAFMQGSPELAERLERHPRFGPPLVGWRRHRVIPPKAKAAAVTMMAASLAALALFADLHPAPLAAAALLIAWGAAYILTRPSRPFRDRSKPEEGSTDS